MTDRKMPYCKECIHAKFKERNIKAGDIWSCGRRHWIFEHTVAMEGVSLKPMECYEKR